MRNTLRRIAWICLGLIVLLFVSIIGVVLFLRSSSASDLILAKAKAFVEKTPGDRLDYKSGSIDFFSGFHFKNLHLVRHQDGLSAVVDIASLDLTYDFSILKRSFEIEDFSVERPVMTVEITPKSNPTPAKQASGSNDDLLLHSPVQFALKHMGVHDLDLDFTQVSQTAQPDGKMVVGKTSAHVRRLSLTTEFAAMAEHLVASGDLHLEDPEHKPIEVALDSRAGQTSLKTSVATRWSAEVRREKGEWVYEIFPSNFDLRLSTVVSKTADLEVQLPSVKMNSKVKLRATSRELFVFTSMSGHGAPADVQLIESSAVIEVGHLIAHKKGLHGTDSILADIESQSVKVKAGLAGEMVFSLEAGLHQIRAPDSLLQPVNVTMALQAHTARDLSHTSFESQAALAGVPLFAMKGELEPSAESVRVKGDVSLTASQKLAAFVKSAANLKKIGDVNLTSHFDVVREKSGAINAKFSADAPALYLAQMLKPMAHPASIKAQGEVQMSQSGGPEIETIRKLIKFDGDLEFLNEDFGHWKLKSKLELAQGPAGALQSTGLTDIEEVEKATSPLVPVVFTKPFTVKHSLDFDQKKADLDLRADVPHLELVQIGDIDDTSFHLSTHSPDLSGLKDVDFKMSLKQSAIRLLAAQKDDSYLPKTIAGIDLTAAGSLRGKSQFNLAELRADVDHSAIVVTASGAANLAVKDAQGKFQLGLEIPKDFPDLAGQKIRGHIDVPVRISMYRGLEISLDSDAGLVDVSWQKPGLAVKGLNGRFPFSEHLKWDGKNVRFTNLITQNPFERVDFERVRPLLQGAQPLRVSEIDWEGKTYGPFVGFFTLSQNMFSVHQFDMDFGNGHLGGEMFFDFYPANMQFGLLSRLTGLNLGEVLPEKYLKRVPKGDKSVSARSGFVLNLRSGSVDGRVDVTEIGGAQLVAMINVLDPNYQDEKMNKVRGLLTYGYPTSVALAFADGYMDMNIGLSVLGLSQEESIREIPISSLLQNALAPILKQSEKGPLK